MKFNSFIKAARADFLPASVLPFIIGAVYAFKAGFSLSFLKIILGLTGVVSLHLAANLLNNYYDYKSGADTRTPKISSFFGGSRVIHEGLYTAKQIFIFSSFFLFAALVCGLALFAVIGDPVFPVMMVAAGILAVGYTAPPLKLAYRKLGELDIFLLFGVFLVTGSFYLFSGRFSLGALVVSLPVSFLISGVIICNEIPDFHSDLSAGKRNLLTFSGIEKGYSLYGSAVFLSLAALLLNVMNGTLPRYAVLITVAYLLGLKAFFNLKNGLADKEKLIQASCLALALHSIIGISIIAVLLAR
jgi:1,4-dihydroxy-2-naphthoate polyprenyltransferase